MQHKNRWDWKNLLDHDHVKYINTQEFDKLTSENFAPRWKEADIARKKDIADFVKKTDFNGKLKNINEKVTSNKSKHVLVENELNELSKKLGKYQIKDIVFLVR